jgi:hypothetical protein
MRQRTRGHGTPLCELVGRLRVDVTSNHRNAPPNRRNPRSDGFSGVPGIGGWSNSPSNDGCLSVDGGPARYADGRRARFHTQLGQDILDVPTDGTRAYEQGCRDLAVRFAFSNASQDLMLT